MIKLQLTFENEAEAMSCLRWSKASSELSDFTMWLRDKSKYGHNWKSADEAVDAIYAELHKLCRPFSED